MKVTNDSVRAQGRREQILRAAERCFRDFGFHAASISKISKAAGMSSGHIYHYFDNKEAIIAAIVMRDLENRLALTETLRAKSGQPEALKQHIADALVRQLDTGLAALKVEILAEAGRNPGVAKIVRDADLASRLAFSKAIREIRRAAGFQDDPRELDGMVEFLAALFGGLTLRIIGNPALEPDLLVSSAQRIVEQALFRSGAMTADGPV